MVQSRNQNGPFGVFFNKIINEEIMKTTNFEFNDNKNRCYCPELLSYIESKLPLASLWTGILLAKLLITFPYEI